MTIVRNFKDAKMRKKVIKAIDKSIELREKQLEIFERNITDRIKKLIKLGKEVKKNKYPIELYLSENKKLTEWLKKFLNCGYKEKNEKKRFYCLF